MKILKFGGTSVGKPERMHHVARLLNRERGPRIVVLSAVSGTTNSLVSIGKLMENGDHFNALKLTSDLKTQYESFYAELLKSSHQPYGHALIGERFHHLESLLKLPYKSSIEREILAQGELLSTGLFHIYLQQEGIKSRLLPALEFMTIDENAEPGIDIIEQKLRKLLSQSSDIDLFITQGFICRNHRKEIDNLKRGGSDYSASLIGAAMRAEELQIWTDIDGMHNNDPRIVEDTYPIAALSFNEAAELAYFGAKILHPSTIWPAQKYNIPVRLLNTMMPEAEGTRISAAQQQGGMKAIAAKDGIIAIKIKSSRMLLAYGFLRRVFEIFEKYKTPIDMITTSEVAVSLTIDQDHNLEAILDELRAFGEVEVQLNHTIICIVGDMVAENTGIVKRIFNALDEMPVRMISYGGSRNNISLLVPSDIKIPALQALNDNIFKKLSEQNQ